MSGLRTVAFFGSDNLLPAQKRVLRPSGGSEGMLSTVIFKPHPSLVYVQQILIVRLRNHCNALPQRAPAVAIAR
jgi:hypothetical protein